MELSNEFRVGVPVATAWAVLTDIERIAPSMPGAQLQEVEGDEYRGIVKVKVGPITAQYKGKATIVEQDVAGGRIVLRAEGRDTRGQGNANATITAQLVADGDGTKVTVDTDLAVTGKVAQFGRGVLAEVSAKLLDQFVASLEADVLSQEDGAAPPPVASATPSASPAAPSSAGNGSASATGATRVTSEVEATQIGNTGIEGLEAAGAAEPGPTVRKIESKEAEPIDLMAAAGGSMRKRAAPVAGTVLLLLWVFLRRRRRNRRRAKG